MNLFKSLWHPLEIVKKFTLWGGGSGGGGGTSQQTTVQELPEWAKPYAQQILSKAQTLTEQPYQTYEAPRIAGFSPDQLAAQQGARDMTVSPELNTATNLAQTAGQGAMDAGKYKAGEFTGGTFGTDQASQYMNPYLMQALNPQIALMQQQQGQQAAQMAGQATQTGAFGGSRFGLAQAQQNLNNQLAQQNLVGQGYNTAFQQAQNQFNADMARRMQAQQLGEQSRQFGANLGLQGYQTGLQAASQLGQLGQTRFGQEMGINQLRNQYGQQQQALEQQGLSQAYQDFLNQQNYPYKQLGFMSDILKGTPTGQSTAMTMYQSPGSMLGQLGGLGLGAYGLSRLMPGGFAEGGEVEGYAGGGLSGLRKFNDAQLREAYENALARRDVELANAIEARLYQMQHTRSMSPEDASIAYGLGGAFNSLPDEYQDNIVRAAGGGVVAFADKGLVDEEEATSTAGNLWRSITGGIQSQLDKAARAGQLREQMKENRVGFFEALTPTQRAERQERGAQLRSQYDELLGRTPAAKSAPAISAYDSDTAERADRMTGGEGPAPKAAPKAAPKVEKSISTALTKMSEQSGVPKEDLITGYDALRKKFDEEGAAERKEVSDLMKSFMGEGKKVRAQALDRALAEFGFSMAAGAAQPGQARGRGLMGAIQSAAAASPVLAKSAAESDKIAREMDRNDQAMALNLKQFEIAQRSGNRKDAMNLAVQQQTLQRQNEQLGLMKRDLDEKIRHNQAVEGLTGQRYAALAGRSADNMTRVKASLVQNAMKQAAKDWADPLQSRTLKQQYPSKEAYARSLYNEMWSQSMPMLEYRGLSDKDED